MSPEPREGFDEDELPPWEVGGAAPDDLWDHPGVVYLSDVVPEQVDWLWPGRIPLGKLTVLEGDPKTGKSTTAIDIAARVSTGSPFPDHAQLSSPGFVILMSAEDGLTDTIRPRLDAAGADPSKVMAWETMPTLNKEGVVNGIRPPSLPLDIEALGNLIIGHSAVLVIVDVLAAYLGSGVDSHKDQDVRRAVDASCQTRRSHPRSHPRPAPLEQGKRRSCNLSRGWKHRHRWGCSISLARSSRSTGRDRQSPGVRSDRKQPRCPCSITCVPPRAKR